MADVCGETERKAMARVSTQFDFVLGAEHVDKIGRAVLLDVEGKAGRSMYAGVLNSTDDYFCAGGDLVRTVVTVGDRKVVLDWRDPGLSVLIECPSLPN